MHLGCAYQIFDDVVDLFAQESEIGKTLGTDLANGKFTLPLLILLESMEEAERATWIDLYKSGQTKRALQGLEAMLGSNPILDKVQVEFDACLKSAESSLSGVGREEREHCLRLMHFLQNLFFSFLT